MILLIVGLPKMKGDWHELWNADWFGIAGFMIGLGAMTVLLEEGHREQWFDSPLIWRLALGSLLGFIMIGWGQFTASRPVVSLALLRKRTLAACVILISMIGALQYGTNFMVPQFLAAVAGYNALQAGKAVFITGISSSLMMPIFPILVARLDVRAIVGTGVLLVASSAFLAAHLTALSTSEDLTFALLLLGAGTALTAVTLQQAAISSVTLADAGAASGLFMVCRNLGGSIGLASIASLQDLRLELHHWQLHASLGANDLAVQQRIAEWSAQMGGGPEGLAAAYRQLDAQMLLDALVMSFNDVFLILGYATLAVAPLVFLLRPFTPGDNAAAVH